MREEVLGGAPRIAGRLGELRLDTDLDISHGVVRYLELVKLAALKERPAGQSVAEALADINQRLLAACTPLQREIFQTSTLDETLLASECTTLELSPAGASEPEPGDGRSGGHGPGEGERSSGWGRRSRPKPPLPLPRLAHSRVARNPRCRRSCPGAATGSCCRRLTSTPTAACPLRYKLGRVLKIPSAQTLHQRFGIAVHQVLERYHAAEHTTVEQMMELFESCWRRGGFGDSDRERELHVKARAALVLYHRHLEAHEAEPVWFERSFSFKLGPHHLRGRVDRVDKLADGAYEMIDYKTSRPKTAEQLARRRAALAVCGWGARVLAGRGRAPLLLLRARRPQGARAQRRDGSRLDRARGGGGRRGDHGAALRADALAERVLRCATTGSPVRLGSGRTLGRARSERVLRCGYALADG